MTGILVVTFGVVQGAKEFEWPRASWWEKGSAGRALYLILATLVSAATLLIVIGYRRLLAREKRRGKFDTAAQSIALLVQDQTSLNHDEIGVNIWLVRGPKGFRRLVREASVVTEQRTETPITWTKNKGIIGEAWGRKKPRFADLDQVRKNFPTRRHWCRLKREDRFRLSWDELGETSRYRAVLAVPLRGHRFARHPVRGVVAIDVLVAGKAAELEGLQTTREFGSIISVCEAALVGDE